MPWSGREDIFPSNYLKTPKICKYVLSYRTDITQYTAAVQHTRYAHIYIYIATGIASFLQFCSKMVDLISH